MRIESSTCAHALLEDVQHLVRVELNAAGLPEGPDAPRVILTCAGRVNLIRVVVGSETDSRQLDLDQTDDGLRARVIALATAELVRDTSARAARRAAEPAPAPVVAPPAAPLVVPTMPTALLNRLVVFAKLGNFGSSFEPLYGGGLGFAHDLGRFSLGLGPELLVSKREVELGAVHVLAANLSARLALRFPSRTLAGEVGIGHALGLARLAGSTTSTEADTATVTGVWAAPFVFGALEPQLGQSFFLQVAAQGGVVTVPVRGQVGRGSDVGVIGAWAGLSVGVGVGL